MKAVYPVIAVAIAFALFYAVIDPTYIRIKDERVKLATIEESLTKIDALTEARDVLIQQRGNIDPNEIARLEKLLPDHVDNIRLVLDISKIAERHLMRVRNVAIETPNDTLGALAGESGSVESLVLSFAVSGSYETLIAFIRDLEQSLRIVDVETMRINVSDAGIYELSLSIRTYWLRP